MSDTIRSRIRYWYNPEQIVYPDDIVIANEYEFTFPNENTYVFTFPNENAYVASADEIIAASEKLKQSESFDDLYPCAEDDLKDVQELL